MAPEKNCCSECVLSLAILYFVVRSSCWVSGREDTVASSEMAVEPSSDTERV